MADRIVADKGARRLAAMIAKSALTVASAGLGVLLLLVGKGMQQNEHVLDVRVGIGVCATGILILAALIWWWRESLPVPGPRSTLTVAGFFVVMGLLGAVALLTAYQFFAEPLLANGVSYWLIGMSALYAATALGLGLELPGARAIARVTLLIAGLQLSLLGAIITFYGWWALLPPQADADRSHDANFVNGVDGH